MPQDCGIEDAKAFWWASVLAAAARCAGAPTAKPKDIIAQALNQEKLEVLLNAILGPRLRGNSPPRVISRAGYASTQRTLRR
jgi:hypothetical protein